MRNTFAGCNLVEKGAGADARGLDNGMPRSRYGVGEWYGRSFVHMSAAERRKLAKLQTMPKGVRPVQPCPFRSAPDHRVSCTKEGGVCSIRLYEEDRETGSVAPAAGASGALVTTCPYRFQEGGLISKWVGEVLLGSDKPFVVGEVGFLEQAEGEEDVGRIDNVLVHPDLTQLKWCPLEIQAVYFSGAAMKKEFSSLRSRRNPEIPFPAGHRRPDYRSSGPKRLMPQLQIKVPTLRRWGKKMAVVVDRRFFEAMGEMDDVTDVTNCDIAWFVVDFDERENRAVLRRDFVRLTTLERAVEGLTGGRPVSLPVFEQRIRAKLGGDR